MPVRIAFTGSHGTGKTSLMTSLMEHVSRLNPQIRIHSIGEVARRLIARGFPMSKEADAGTFVNYIIEYLREERSAADYDLLLSDRTILDAYAYATVNQTAPEATVVPPDIVELLKESWLRQRQMYDFYVFIPIEFPMAPDGVRPEDEQYRRPISSALLSYLRKDGTSYISVRGSMRERIDAVVRHLHGHGFSLPAPP